MKHIVVDLEMNKVGKEHRNVKILSSKLLKAKEQVNISKSKNKQSDKNQHEKVNGTISPKSILGVIQEFKEEEKAKPSSDPATMSATPTSTMRRSGTKSPRVPYRKHATPRTMPGMAVIRPDASPAPMSAATRR